MPDLRSEMIRLASGLPVGDSARREILAALRLPTTREATTKKADAYNPIEDGLGILRRVRTRVDDELTDSLADWMKSQKYVLEDHRFKLEMWENPSIVFDLGRGTLLYQVTLLDDSDEGSRPKEEVVAVIRAMGVDRFKLKPSRYGWAIVMQGKV